VAGQGETARVISHLWSSPHVTFLWGQVGETFDWRLAIPNVQKRDSYFTKLKARLELIISVHDQKVAALPSHFYCMITVPAVIIVRKNPKEKVWSMLNGTVDVFSSFVQVQPISHPVCGLRVRTWNQWEENTQ
jgi:hypothetical protein